MDDPYEGLPWAMQFPHRYWKSITDVPESLRNQLLADSRAQVSPDAAFRSWFKLEEEKWVMMRSGRREFYLRAGLETLRAVPIPCEAPGQDADMGDEYPRLG
ncbi:hypothetical protein, partial [Amaricoccus solimangrovi]